MPVVHFDDPKWVLDPMMADTYSIIITFPVGSGRDGQMLSDELGMGGVFWGWTELVGG
jgi:hypothetical protein